MIVGIVANACYVLGVLTEVCVFGAFGSGYGRERYILFGVEQLFSMYLVFALASRGAQYFQSHGFP